MQDFQRRSDSATSNSIFRHGSFPPSSYELRSSRAIGHRGGSENFRNAALSLLLLLLFQRSDLEFYGAIVWKIEEKVSLCAPQGLYHPATAPSLQCFNRVITLFDTSDDWLLFFEGFGGT